MEKYLNEAIIGNQRMLATFSYKGEMLRLSYPNKDNRQYLKYYQTGVKVNDSDLIYLHEDINNTYLQYYDTDTNVLNTEITNTYFNLKILRTCVSNHLGKSWGKTSQKSSKKYTNVRKTNSPIFIEISAKTLDFTKLHKPFNYAS